MKNSDSKVLSLPVIVAALGYFVDIFDLFLFGTVRVASLKDLGLNGDQLLEAGVSLLNMQMLGVLIGGVLWGILGDKKGRVSVLFGSIFLYSSANLVNGFIHSIEWYGVLRFLAGLGLAGELGAAVTLVSEILPKEKRAYGTTIVASFGLCGSIAAGLTAEYVSWRTAYIIGGVLGLALLLLRIRISESHLFQNVQNANVIRGKFLMIFTNKERFLRYLYLILIGVPIWCTVGIVITFAPEYATALNVLEPVTAGKAIFYTYIGVALGDFASGLWSQWVRSRRKILAAFILQLAVLLGIFLNFSGMSVYEFYLMCVLLGFATGYWAVLMTTAAESFGTNLRSTVSTSVPNFIRASVVPISFLFKPLKEQIGLIHSTLVLATLCIMLAFWALWNLKETSQVSLDFLEES